MTESHLSSEDPPPSPFQRHLQSTNGSPPSKSWVIRRTVLRCKPLTVQRGTVLCAASTPKSGMFFGIFSARNSADVTTLIVCHCFSFQMRLSEILCLSPSSPTVHPLLISSQDGALRSQQSSVVRLRARGAAGPASHPLPAQSGGHPAPSASRQRKVGPREPTPGQTGLGPWKQPCREQRAQSRFSAGPKTSIQRRGGAARMHGFWVQLTGQT